MPVSEIEEATAPVQPGTLNISDREFARYQDFVYRETGIFLGPQKKALIVSRLGRRLRALGLPTFGAYFDYATSEDTNERITMIDSICTNETSFFRDKRQFDFLEHTLVPAWVEGARAGRRPKRARVWSAACSTGEEPYTIAMSLAATLPDDWQIEILATDLSTKALARATAGVWPIARAEQIPEQYLKRFMLKGVRSQEGFMTATEELRDMIRFEQMNLNDESYAVAGRHDAIFCRNVLIYFDQPSKVNVIRRLASHLDEGGVLFLGHAESITGLAPDMHSVGPNAYARV